MTKLLVCDIVLEGGIKMSKVITVSLPDGIHRKFKLLADKTGISKSGLMQRALCLLISEFEAYELPKGLIRTIEDIEQEYRDPKKKGG